MRELSSNEINETSGGILPFIAAVVIIDLALISVTAGMMSGAGEHSIETKTQTKHKCTLY